MTYEADLDTYIAQVTRLSIEIEYLTTKPLSAVEMSQVRDFQKQNDYARDTLNKHRSTLVAAYVASDSEGKAKLETDLREMQSGLETVQKEFRRAFVRDR
jgi:hypothetical protein